VEDSVRAAVDDYRQHRQRHHNRELDYFRLRRLSDEKAVTVAALCQLPSGKRHPHQYRIPGHALEEAERVLLANLQQLRSCSTFDELLGLVEQLTDPIYKIGPLTVYDISLRIGARLRLEPELVYLHRGTRDGAHRLGLDWRSNALEPAALPAPLQVLKPHEVEDVLCIYKHWFPGS
jgi:hypothetical protein